MSSFPFPYHHTTCPRNRNVNIHQNHQNTISTPTPYTSSHPTITPLHFLHLNFLLVAIYIPHPFTMTKKKFFAANTCYTPDYNPNLGQGGNKPPKKPKNLAAIVAEMHKEKRQQKKQAEAEKKKWG
ncbi:MAG: Uncharacterized protein AUREO_000440 [Aureobasidium pullulans]|nr:MAG: Uncharacterized protein AUREO_000440 [Aureobasidium pullulans]